MTALESSLASAFNRLVGTQPEATALIDAERGTTWSYSQLDVLTNRIASFLRTRCAGGERPVVTLLPNSVDALVFFLGALRAGIDVAPLTPQATSSDLEKWLTLVRPGFCVYSLASEEVVERVADIGARLSIVPNGTFEWLEREGAVSDPPRTDRPARLLLHTSGTTGEPKVLVFDCDRLWASGRAFARHHDFLDPNCRFFNILPMSYLGGLFNLALIPLGVGGSIAVGDAFTGRSFISFWQDVARLEVNVLWLVPTIMKGLLALAARTRASGAPVAPSAVRACFVGTAAIDSATKRKFEEVFGIPVLENYALSETTFITSETLGSRYQRKDRSVGEVLPYVDLRCIPTSEDEEGTLVHEIQVKTPHLFVGYLGANAEIEPPQESDDGYFSTGDLGSLDDNRLLLYHGRTRDIVKKGGYLVVLREVEVLAEQHPLVVEAAAVPIPDDFYGEDYILAVRVAESVEEEECLSEIRIWVNKSLARYKWPARIVVCSDLPRTQSGKIRKRLLAEQLASR